MEKFKVVFKPDNKEIVADRGEILLSCAIKGGIYINSSCGGDGIYRTIQDFVEKDFFWIMTLHLPHMPSPPQDEFI